MRSDFDLAIIGSGFSGSLLAMIARRTGRSVMLLDRSAHPRFAIGESTSPLLNLVIEQIASRYDLPRLKPLTTWGEWQRTYPQMVGGLKRGSTYFKHESGARYRAAPDRSNQLLVSACLNDEAADTHWLRSDVDYFLLQEAIASGADFLDQTELHSIELANDAGARLRGERRGRVVNLRARLIVDASGPRGFLSRALGLAERRFDDFPATQALYSHFIGVHRCDAMPDYEVTGNPPYPPYPMDDAAVHHVFEGGWMWVLRFNNGVTSAGIAVTEETARELKLSEGEAAWRRFLARFPSIAAQFAEARAIREFTWAPRLAYRSEMAAGEGWAMLPSAAAFVDPLFGPGMPMSALGVERLGRLLEENPDALNERLREYSRTTLVEADHTANFIAGCYAAFPQFELFTSLSMVYFAAAGYCEMARRLGRNHLAQRFLAVDHPDFANSTARLSQILRRNDGFDSTLFHAQVKRKIDCLNVAGLCDPRKRNWYDVDLEDVVTCAEKLEITSEEMRRFLLTSSWAQTTVNLRQSRLKRQPHQSIQLGVYQRRLPGEDDYEPVGELVGDSPAFQRMIEDALNVAPTDTTVLLQGETGTGKELLAYAIHQHSLRKPGPFVVVNCAALPPSLIESELFGYEKGAFTGALLRKPGRFELADGGTIFLDEIGEVPLELQGRFLRVLQTGVFERLGGAKSVRVKVRIIAATNQPLERLVNERKFRADLFYRLNVFPITLPPLRERSSDIPLLAQHFLDKYNARFKRSITSISKQSLHALEQYHWPGNVRELENLVERAVLSADGAILKIAPPAVHVEPAIGDKLSEAVTAIPDNSAIRLASLTDNEQAHIQMVLRHTGGRISGPRGAAKILGVPPSTLRSRIKKLGLKIYLDDPQ